MKILCACAVNQPNGRTYGNHPKSTKEGYVQARCGDDVTALLLGQRADGDCCRATFGCEGEEDRRGQAAGDESRADDLVAGPPVLGSPQEEDAGQPADTAQKGAELDEEHGSQRTPTPASGVGAS